MNKDCHDHCGEIASQRLRYFTGRFMTARDIRDEQAYHRSHRYLHNRMLHGWGVVCGLHVHPHQDENCARDHVRIDCGFAMDCCGRELPVHQTQVSPPIPWKERAPTAETTPIEDRFYPLLCVEYCESEIECVPVLYNESCCDPQRHEFSRYQEGARFVWHWVRYSELAQYHWKTRGRGSPEPHQLEHAHWNCIEDDCDDHGPAPKTCCLDLQCPPHHCVPLAFIQSEPGQPIHKDKIRLFGRPTLEPPITALTHIFRINWPHGGLVSRRHLEHHLKVLKIQFDRRLRRGRRHPQFSGPHGVNASTFIVQFGGEEEDLDFVPYPETEPPHLVNDCIAVYPIDPRHHQRPYCYLENHTVYITLKCDFLLDCHGVAVDGNHIGGVLPSGDGVPGGTFESWFHVVPDGDYDRCRAEFEQEAQNK